MFDFHRDQAYFLACLVWKWTRHHFTCLYTITNTQWKSWQQMHVWRQGYAVMVYLTAFLFLDTWSGKERNRILQWKPGSRKIQRTSKRHESILQRAALSTERVIRRSKKKVPQCGECHEVLSKKMGSFTEVVWWASTGDTKLTYTGIRSKYFGPPLLRYLFLGSLDTKYDSLW